MAEFRHLEVFRSVMQAGGFTKAANKLRTSQPTVSRSIAELQAEIGFKLFIRKGSAVVPTREAVELYGVVDRSFAGIDTILREAEAIAGRRTGNLRILSMPALAWSFLPQVVGRFLSTRPGVKVSIDVQRSEAIAGWSSIEYFDVGFSMLPIHRHGVETSLFDEARAVCVMPRGHELAAKERIGPADLHGKNFISSGPFGFGGTQQKLDAIMAEAGASYIVKAETPISAIACELVANGVGVAIVDHFVARTFQHYGLTIRPILPQLSFQYGVFQPTTAIPHSLAAEFIEAAGAARDELMAQGG